MIFYVRSGITRVDAKGDTTLRGSGDNKFMWSRLSMDFGAAIYDANKLATAGGINFGIKTTTSSDERHRFFGDPLRCLSTAVEGEEKWEDKLMDE